MITNLLGSDYSDSANNNNSATTNSLVNKPVNSNGDTTVVSRPAVSRNQCWEQRLINSWKQISLRRKATLFAIALGIFPVALVGGIAHQLAARSLTEQIVSEQESRTFDIGQKVSLFTNHIISDANTIAASPLLADPQLSAQATDEHKVALLNDFIKKHPLERYDNIAVYDPNGNLLFQSQSTDPLDPEENYSTHDYFQRAISSKSAAVNDPEIHTESGKNNLSVASPILNRQTGEVLGVVRLQMSLSHWKKIFQYVKAEGWEYRLIDTEGYIFDTDESDYIGQSTGSDLKKLPQLQAKISFQKENNFNEEALIATDIMKDLNDDTQVVASVAAISNVQGVMAPGWEIVLSRPVDQAFASLRQLRLILLLGTTGAAILVGAIAAVVVSRATAPIVEAAGAVEKISQGDLDTRLEVAGRDELAVLGTNINKMAKKLKLFMRYQAAEAKRSQRLKDITLKLSRAESSKEVFQVALQEILLALEADRALIYRLEPGGEGKILAESTVGQSTSLLQAQTTSLEYLEKYFAENRLNKVQAISNIYTTNLDVNHLQQLEAWDVKAELIAPFSTGKDCQNLLVLHQCGQSRQWQQIEIDFFTQLVSQVVLAWERTNLLQQQKTAREDLQYQALGLLTEVEPISRGDLTIRATVTEGEIGTIADSYNSTVENLREIVLQVQKSTTQMAAATSNSEEFARSLSERASLQSQAIAAALNQIQAMAESVQAVAVNTEEVESTFQEVLQTVATGDAAMDRTVAGILDIRETVAETAKKVKRLGESSQKISKVVNLIGSFASQTNLLALNASLEASRAGEEEHNFTVVAEEIRTLAQQSAEATTEIEKIVASIQLDTKEVFKAMEEGIERVVIGTKLVDETRQSLNQVAASSQKVNSRIAEIAQETVEESQASQKITRTIAEVAEMANTTSTDAEQVSVSTKELLAVAEELQASVSRFKA